FEGGQMPLHMRLPKRDGFRNRNRVEYQVVNLSAIGALFPEGGEIDVEGLAAAGAVRPGHLVKILGDGELGVAGAIRADALPASPREKIAAAGGWAVDLYPPGRGGAPARARRGSPRRAPRPPPWTRGRPTLSVRQPSRRWAQAAVGET